MSEIVTIGLDLAKNIFQVHGIDACDKVIVRKPLRRSKMMTFSGLFKRRPTSAPPRPIGQVNKISG